MASGIPYKLVGGTSLLDSTLVKDALAYCKLALNPQDDPSFMRIVNKPARRLGEVLPARPGFCRWVRPCHRWVVVLAQACKGVF